MQCPVYWLCTLTTFFVTAQCTETNERLSYTKSFSTLRDGTTCLALSSLHTAIVYIILY